MAESSKSLKDYLKRYESNNAEEKKAKKKKKKITKPEAKRMLVVDEDPVWQKPVTIEEDDENDSAEEERPQIDEDIEVRRMKRLEQLRAKRPYGAIAEDGSGWISLSSHEQANVTKPYSDMSPPRRRNDTPSPEPSGTNLNSDLSPPRKQRARNDTPSPQRNMNSDLSPPRKRRVRNDTPSPGRNMNSDLSLPRKRRVQNGTPSPGRNMNSDLSPPRKRRVRNDTPSPGRNMNSDLSPPRKKKVIKSDVIDAPDISPQRVHRGSSNQDLSPPRKSSRQSSGTGNVTEKRKTGLISGKDIRLQVLQTKKDEISSFSQMDPSLSGRGAEPVYRDRNKGLRISKEEYLKSKQKVEEKPKEIKLEWGKGLAQKRETEARLEELELEKDKPFARTRDDPELDKELKERVRWGDPMAHLVKKKQFEPVLKDLGDSDKMKESGFIIPQDIPGYSWIKRGLDAAPNRYGIRPGRHWDGVDRSTGFEKKMFQRTNEKKATEREAYLWSVADM